MQEQPPTPELSIIVVLYNSADELPACLSSIIADVATGWAELILVDNASPDDSVDVARKVAPDAAVISLPENLGFAGGVNTALPRAKGRYILLLNPDVTVSPGGLHALTGWLDENFEVGVASPDIVDAKTGRRENPPRPMPSFWRTVLEMSRIHKLLPYDLRSRLLMGAYWNGKDTTDAGWVPGTAMFVRAAAIGRVGMLSGHLFMYGEDIEWCCRMRRAGYLAGVRTGSPFVHHGSTSATRSWGAHEQRRRMAAGSHAACEMMYGVGHARLIAAATAAALWVEAKSPGRSEEHRREAAASARQWRALALRR